MALSTARIHRVRGCPPLLAAGIKSLLHSHSSSVRSLGYIVSFISPCYTTHEDFSDRLSDQKSRGFHIHQSHISDVQRLSRLFIAACLAYIWIVYLGSVCEKDRWRHIIHRRKRCA